MNTLLTICIPTYRRDATLRRCIESLVSQIDKLGLSRDVNIYVANDASPDDTAAVLDLYQPLSYFKAVTREHNLGMNLNIKHMLEEASRQSDYQLIITDDDYLQPDALGEVVALLRQHEAAGDQIPAIWTPRYSYTEDGTLHCVVCNPFKQSRKVRPSAANAGKYMENGFVLSGLIVRGDRIDYGFWDSYRENAYFPAIFLGDLILRGGAQYWSRNIVRHTVLNECHWERWGKNEVMIEIRLFCDYVNAYAIIAKRIHSLVGKVTFQFTSFPSIYRAVRGFLKSDKLKIGSATAIDAIQELKARGAVAFGVPLRQLLTMAFAASTSMSMTKLVVLRVLSVLDRRGRHREHYLKRSDAHIESLQAAPVVFKVIWS